MESIVIHANKYDSAICEVVTTTEKAMNIKNTESKKSCWIPKAGLKPYKPGVATYENEFVIARWFLEKMNHFQEVVLNLAE